MRRVACALTALMIGVFCLVCSAQEAGFSCEYTPKSERSSVFYIDVDCEREISAAVFSLDYDEKIVSFRSVEASGSATAVRGNDAGGKVTVALADSGSVKGKLCRLAFQALSQGETSFVLRVSQAVDASMQKTDVAEEYTLTVTFDKDDVAASSSKGSKSSSSSSSKTSSSSKGRSGGSGIWGSGDGSSDGGSYYDLRPDNTWIYILIGAGSMVLLAAGIGITVYLMKKKKPQPEQNDVSAEPESEDAPDDDKSELIEELNNEVLGDADTDDE